MNVRVLACQQPLHERLSDQTLTRIEQMSPDFVCLPEHYPLPQHLTNLQQAAALFEERKSYLASVSSALRAVLVGGTLTEEIENGYFNTCYVFEDGKEIGFYRKVHPTQGEQERGVLQGTEFKMFELRGIRIGVLICADVLNARSFEELASLKCQITFVPTASPFRPDESIATKYERDHSIFLEGARRIGCPIVKTCGVGTTFGHPIQGRSLIVTPERIIARAKPHQEQEQLLLFAELNL